MILQFLLLCGFCFGGVCVSLCVCLFLHHLMSALFFFAIISFIHFYISCVVKIAPAGTSPGMTCTD